MTKLTEIKGVGPATAKKLAEQGFDSVEALPNDIDQLAALDFNDAEIDQIMSIQAEANESEPNPETTTEVQTEPGATTEGEAEADNEPNAESQEAEQSNDSNEPDTSDGSDENDTQDTEADVPAVDTSLVISFAIQSGAHKGRTLTWRNGDPAARFQDGAYASLETLSVNALDVDEEEGTTDFALVWGPTKGRGTLPTEQFKLFSEEVRKKPKAQLYRA